MLIKWFRYMYSSLLIDPETYGQSSEIVVQRSEIVLQNGIEDLTNIRTRNGIVDLSNNPTGTASTKNHDATDLYHLEENDHNLDENLSDGQDESDLIMESSENEEQTTLIESLIIGLFEFVISLFDKGRFDPVFNLFHDDSCEVQKELSEEMERGTYERLRK